MMRHAIVDTSTNIVVNVIDYDSDISNTVPPGMEPPMLAVKSDTAQIGWPYQDGVFTNPNKLPIADSQYDWGPKLVELVGRY